MNTPANPSALDAAVKRRDYPAIKQILLDRIAQGGNAGQNFSQLARIAFLLDRLEDALEAISSAGKSGPITAELRFTQALAWQRLTKYDEARQAWTALGTDFPQDPVPAYWLGRLEADLQRYEVAKTHLKRAIRLNPAFLRAYPVLGLCEEFTGADENALAVYLDGMSRNQQSKQPLVDIPLNLGALLEKLNRLPEAEKALRAGLPIRPPSAPLHFRLGLVLEKQKKLEAAAAEYRAAGGVNPQYPEAHLALGRLLTRMGQTAEAQKELDRFQELKAKKPGQK
ncbi:MAG: tetratricopeptide repeat protein [Acidobacteria bacterium]|nr:tetratricopeptide repeat protein [Acidobacteriota bacterium]